MEGEVSIVTSVMEEETPLYHTGKSLVCTISANGHAWGKPLGKDSRDSDVELEIFTPVNGGYLFRRKGEKLGKLLNYCDKKLTESQFKRVNLILQQKERLKYMLGTLMISPWYNYGISHYMRSEHQNEPHRLNFTHPDFVTVADCTHVSRSSNKAHFAVLYDSFEFSFKLSVARKDGLKLCHGGDVIGVNTILYPDYIKDLMYDNLGSYPHYEFYAVRAADGAFSMRSAGGRYSNIFMNELRVMWGEYDFFEVFDIDEAVLLLEEYKKSETESELYWTLGIAQNKIARNLIRLAANNKNLFKPVMGR